jgi:tRNA 2-(methylsulfanyl)-N6-isopentenyladenosine37 hydroxylase
MPEVTLPLRSQTPVKWAVDALQHPLALLSDHAFLERKAANNALELMTKWPGDYVTGWVETLAAIARDEAAHLAQVSRVLTKRGGRLNRVHKNSYANELRLHVRKGSAGEILDRLFVSALIEARSCERFGVLAEAAQAADPELAKFYRALYSSELGHYKVFLKLATRISKRDVADPRWQEWLDCEATILAQQEPGPRIHSGVGKS